MVSQRSTHLRSGVCHSLAWEPSLCLCTFRFFSFSLLFCLLLPLIYPLFKSLFRAHSPTNPTPNTYTRTENFFLNQFLIRTTMRASYRSPRYGFFPMPLLLRFFDLSLFLRTCPIWRLILARCGVMIKWRIVSLSPPPIYINGRYLSVSVACAVSWVYVSTALHVSSGNTVG